MSEVLRARPDAVPAPAGSFSESDKRFYDKLLSETFNSVTRIEERSLNNRLTEGLTIAEIHTLAAIGLGRKVPMSVVVDTLGVTPATVTVAINRLEKKGFVERSRGEQDRRQVLISLTKSGRKAVRVHNHFHRKMVDQALDGLTNDEGVALIKALTNVKNFFDRECESSK